MTQPKKRHTRPSKNKLGEKRKNFVVRLHESTVHAYRQQAMRLGLGRDYSFLIEDALLAMMPIVKKKEYVRADLAPQGETKSSFGIKIFPDLLEKSGNIARAKKFKSMSAFIEECLLQYLSTLEAEDAIVVDEDECEYFNVRLHKSTVRSYESHAKRLQADDVSVLIGEALDVQTPKLQSLKKKSALAPEAGDKVSYTIRVGSLPLQQARTVSLSHGYKSVSEVIEECMLRHITILEKRKAL